MKIQANILCLELEDLTQAGVPFDTLRKASYRSSSSFDFLDDVSDRRKRLVVWDTLKDEYKAMVLRVFGEPKEYLAAQILDRYLILEHDPSDRSFLHSYRSNDDKSLTLDQQEKYLIAIQYLRLSASVKAMATFANRDEFYHAICRLIKARKICLPTTPATLRRKLREFKKEGIGSIIPGHIGNKRAQKLTNEQLQWCLSVYGSHQKPSIEMVYTLYLAEAKIQNWPSVTISALKKYFGPGTSWRQAADYMRDPVLHKQQYLHSISTSPVARRNSLWESDGTKLNLFYKDANGKIKADLEIYLVADAATQFILGYHISHSEDHTTVYSAFRMAVNAAGVRPYQILFDNGGAHAAHATQKFIKNISSVAFTTMPYNGQSKSIEKTIGEWQDQVLRYFDNFTGMNVKTRTNDSQANMDWLKANKQAIPDKAGAIQQAIESIAVWNRKQQAKGGSPMERFHKMTEGGSALQIWDMVDMFWLERKDAVTYRKDGITLELRGERRIYAVYQESGAIDEQFLIDHCLKPFVVRYDPENIDEIQLYLQESEDRRWIATAKTKQRVAKAVADYQAGERILIERELQTKRNQLDKLKSMGEEASAYGTFQLGFSQVYKQELNDAEGHILVQQMEAPSSIPTRSNRGKKSAKQIDLMLPDDYTEGADVTDEL
jgi:hypothetical protein